MECVYRRVDHTVPSDGQAARKRKGEEIEIRLCKAWEYSSRQRQGRENAGCVSSLLRWVHKHIVDLSISLRFPNSKHIAPRHTRGTNKTKIKIQQRHKTL